MSSLTISYDLVLRKRKCKAKAKPNLHVCKDILCSFSSFMLTRHICTQVTKHLSNQGHRMKLSSIAVSVLCTTLATNASAFNAPSSPAFVTRSSMSTTTRSSLNMAEVSKLSDPLPQLIDDVDVFIFDCDGVIWRVS